MKHLDRTMAELEACTWKELNFVIEYCKDFNARRAATASGWAPDSAYEVRDRPVVEAAIAVVLKDRLRISDIDAEWLLMEMVDNSQIAKQGGNISASNTALGLVAKHKMVDAFAAEKIQVIDGKQIMAKLTDGRDRVAAARARLKKDKEPNFF